MESAFSSLEAIFHDIVKTLYADAIRPDINMPDADPDTSSSSQEATV